jgi:hypothetical protein
VAADTGEPHGALDLLPLADATFQAETLFRQERTDAILDIVESCAQARFVDIGRLRQDARGCRDKQEFDLRRAGAGGRVPVRPGGVQAAVLYPGH